MELSAGDAGRLGVAEGDLLEVATPRGSVRGRLRVSGIRDGVVFLPFHYGYWDDPDDSDGARAANELTLTAWDPASKQPIFKTAAASVRLVMEADGATSPAPTTTASAPVAGSPPPTRGRTGGRDGGADRGRCAVKIDLALEELHRSENELAAQLLAVSDRHKADHEVCSVARALAAWSRDHVREIAVVGRGYGLDLDPEPAGDPTVLERVRQEISDRLGRRSAPALVLLRDLRSIYLDASGVFVDWELAGQAAQGVRDRELLDVSERCRSQTRRQATWANAQLKEKATQILVS